MEYQIILCEVTPDGNVETTIPGKVFTFQADAIAYATQLTRMMQAAMFPVEIRVQKF